MVFATFKIVCVDILYLKIRKRIYKSIQTKFDLHSFGTNSSYSKLFPLDSLFNTLSTDDTYFKSSCINSITNILTKYFATLLH